MASSGALVHQALDQVFLLVRCCLFEQALEGELSALEATARKTANGRGLRDAFTDILEAELVRQDLLATFLGTFAQDGCAELTDSASAAKQTQLVRYPVERQVGSSGSPCTLVGQLLVASLGHGFLESLLGHPSRLEQSGSTCASGTGSAHTQASQLQALGHAKTGGDECQHRAASSGQLLCGRLFLGGQGQCLALTRLSELAQGVGVNLVGDELERAGDGAAQTGRSRVEQFHCVAAVFAVCSQLSTASGYLGELLSLLCLELSQAFAVDLGLGWLVLPEQGCDAGVDGRADALERPGLLGRGLGLRRCGGERRESKRDCFLCWLRGRLRCGSRSWRRHAWERERNRGARWLRSHRSGSGPAQRSTRSAFFRFRQARHRPREPRVHPRIHSKDIAAQSRVLVQVQTVSFIRVR